MAKLRTMPQMVCTGLFALAWVFFFIILIVFHTAVSSLLPELRDFPDNLSKGFQQGFGFADLEQGGLDVQSQASIALQKCGTTASSCATSSIPLQTCTSRPDLCCDTTAEVNQINAIFSSTLTTIQKVTNDKYFGVSDFQSSASSLNDITDQLKNVPTGSSPMQPNNDVFCQIYRDTTTLLDSVASVNRQIDTFTTGDSVNDVKDGVDRLSALHGLPYCMLLSMLFFACFWYAEKPACCCCGGKFLSGCAFFFHLSCCWFLFVWCAVFIAVRGLTLDQIEKTRASNFEGNPTVKEVIDHIQNEWPVFWDIAMKKLVDALDGFVNSMASAMALVLIIFIYSCGLCIMCGKPYSEKNADSVADSRTVGVVPVPPSNDKPAAP